VWTSGGLIRKEIPSFDLIFTVDKDRLAISEANLTDTQQRTLPLLERIARRESGDRKTRGWASSRSGRRYTA